MNLAYEPLFTPFSIRNTRIKNRYFMAAMGTVTHNDEDGAYLPDAVDYFVRRAAGGVGLIITGANWWTITLRSTAPVLSRARRSAPGNTSRPRAS